MVFLNRCISNLPKDIQRIVVPQIFWMVYSRPHLNSLKCDFNLIYWDASQSVQSNQVWNCLPQPDTVDLTPHVRITFLNSKNSLISGVIKPHRRRVPVACSTVNLCREHWRISALHDRGDGGEDEGINRLFVRRMRWWTESKDSVAFQASKSGE